jgi:hypothetical protein
MIHGPLDEALMVLMHEAAHLQDFKNNWPASQRDQLMSEVHAYQASVHWGQLLGLSQNRINWDRFIADRIPDNDYGGIMAQAVLDPAHYGPQAMAPLLQAQDYFQAIGISAPEYTSSVTASSNFYGVSITGYSMNFHFGGTDHAIFVDISGEHLSYNNQWLIKQGGQWIPYSPPEVEEVRGLVFPGQTIYFTAAGIIIKIITFDALGNVESMVVRPGMEYVLPAYVNVYDGDLPPTLVARNNYDATGTLVSFTIYNPTPDALGPPIEARGVIFPGQGIQYTADGSVIRIITFGINGNVTSVEVPDVTRENEPLAYENIYNGSGLLVARNYYNSANMLISYELYIPVRVTDPIEVIAARDALDAILGADTYQVAGVNAVLSDAGWQVTINTCVGQNDNGDPILAGFRFMVTPGAGGQPPAVTLVGVSDNLSQEQLDALRNALLATGEANRQAYTAEWRANNPNRQNEIKEEYKNANRAGYFAYYRSAFRGLSESMMESMLDLSASVYAAYRARTEESNAVDARLAAEAQAALDLLIAAGTVPPEPPAPEAGEMVQQTSQAAPVQGSVEFDAKKYAEAEAARLAAELAALGISNSQTQAQTAEQRAAQELANQQNQ